MEFIKEGTDKPKGRMADKELRYWKMAAHEAFDPLWQSKRMKRDEAYAWLAGRMGLRPEDTHIGMFDVPECKKVIKICNDERSFRNGKHRS